MKYKVSLRTPDKDNIIDIPEDAVIAGMWDNPGKAVGIVYLTPVEEEEEKEEVGKGEGKEEGKKG